MIFLMEEQELILKSNQLKALSSDTRQEILKLLLSRNHTVSELARKLNCSKSTIYEHIKKLEEAGLVERIDNGFAHKWVYYRVTRKGTMFFDKSRRILLVLAGIFLILALVQFGILFFGVSAQQMSKLESTVAIRKSEETIVTDYEKGLEIKNVYTPDRTQITQQNLLIYCALFCFLLGLGLLFYSLAKKPKLAIKLSKNTESDERN
ncbi:MAG: winged helix-turn-helix domain-containing protein [Candidatus Diapherotrites archaeon]